MFAISHSRVKVSIIFHSIESLLFLAALFRIKCTWWTYTICECAFVLNIFFLLPGYWSGWRTFHWWDNPSCSRSLALFLSLECYWLVQNECAANSHWYTGVFYELRMHVHTSYEIMKSSAWLFPLDYRPLFLVMLSFTNRCLCFWLLIRAMVVFKKLG